MGGLSLSLPILQTQPEAWRETGEPLRAGRPRKEFTGPSSHQLRDRWTHRGPEGNPFAPMSPGLEPRGPNCSLGFPTRSGLRLQLSKPQPRRPRQPRAWPEGPACCQAQEWVVRRSGGQSNPKSQVPLAVMSLPPGIPRNLLIYLFIPVTC